MVSPQLWSLCMQFYPTLTMIIYKKLIAIIFCIIQEKTILINLIKTIFCESTNYFHFIIDKGEVFVSAY